MTSSFQPLSDSVYNKKYQLHDKYGNAIDQDREATFARVAKALAKNEENSGFWEEHFLGAMRRGAIPAGRILSNAGAEEHKPNTSLINCLVSRSVEDSITGISEALKEALISLSAGSGVGYEFSLLRPKGAFVNGVGAKTSGPLPFAEIFDRACATIASAGGRRGAQMATFDLRHPDVVDFIKVKREDGRFRQFNISVLLPDDFMHQSQEQDWIFRFPIRVTDVEIEKTFEKNLWDYWPVEDEHYVYNDKGLALFKEYGRIKKKELIDLIMKSTYDYSEPGVIFIDRVNKENNLWFCEDIRASNPCVVAGTQVLTRNGYKSIETLLGQSVDIWNGFEWSTVEPKITGVDQEVLRISFSNLTTLTCTKYHRFLLKNGLVVEAKDLKLSDELVMFKLPHSDVINSPVVENIEDAGIAELVYCFNEPKRHTAVFNGTLTLQCSEQMLPPSGACLLGSIDLTKFVRNQFTDAGYFDWREYKRTVAVFTRMLDNVVEFSNLPIQQQQNEILYKRRHGMGIFGLGSALCMLKIKYGTPEAIQFTRRVMLEMSVVGYQTGVDLAKEKGPAPIFNSKFEITPAHARFNQFGKENIGKTFNGRDLFAESSYIQRLIKESGDHDLLVELKRHGCRFTHHTSVAPTGTISLALGNNASNGIEPDFSHHYYRNLTVEGKKTRQQEAVYSKSFLEWKAFNNPDYTDEELLKTLPAYFATADSLTWKEHIDMMAAAQEFTDSSISKTINTSTDISFEEFKDVYQYAYDQGCKSVATYRYNPETLGAILSRSEDLESSRYQFTLEDGTVLECKGSDKIQYDGETTTAENLFNSLKEKIYGRF